MGLGNLAAETWHLRITSSLTRARKRCLRRASVNYRRQDDDFVSFTRN